MEQEEFNKMMKTKCDILKTNIDSSIEDIDAKISNKIKIEKEATVDCINKASHKLEKEIKRLDKILVTKRMTCY